MQEEKQIQEQVIEENGVQDMDAIKIIDELKSNSVAKADYDNLSQKYTELLQAYAERRTPEIDHTSKEDIALTKTNRIKELREEMFSGDGIKTSNYEYAKKALELRDLVLETEGKDIFSNSASNASGTHERAELVARHLKDLIVQAENTSSPAEAFTGLFKGSVVEYPKARRK